MEPDAQNQILNYLKDQKFLISTETKKQEWDSFVETSPQRSIFVTSTFLDCLHESYKLITIKENNTIRAGTVVFEKNGHPNSHIPPFTQYIGFLLSPPEDLKGQSHIAWEYKITEILLYFLFENFEDLAFSHSYNLKDLRPFLWMNYGKEGCKKFITNLRYTAVLAKQDYEDQEKYLMNIRTTRRQEYRKAKNLLTIKKSKSTSEILELYTETIKRSTNKELTSKSEHNKLNQILDKCLKENIGDLFYSVHDEKKVGGIFVLKYQTFLYYLVGASTEEGRKMFSNTYLIIEVLKKYFSEHYQKFDFLGVNSPNRGDFKLSFGGQLIKFFETRLENKL